MTFSTSGLEARPHLSIATNDTLKLYLESLGAIKDPHGGMGEDIKARDKRMMELFNDYLAASYDMPMNADSTLFRIGLYGGVAGALHDRPGAGEMRLDEATAHRVLHPTEATIAQYFYMYQGGLRDNQIRRTSAVLHELTKDKLKDLEDVAEIQVDFGLPPINVKLSCMAMAATFAEKPGLREHFLDKILGLVE